MGEFFKPWRRKIGVVTLVMACLFASGWVRSIFIADVIEYTTGKFSQEEFHSVDGFLSWWSDKYFDESAVPFDTSIPSFRWNGGTTTAAFFSSHYGLNEVPIEWRFRFPGLGAGAAPIDVIGNASRKLHFVSYWLIVAPLTLLSAWLLLSKPRKSTPKKITEPIPNEGRKGCMGTPLLVGLRREPE